MAREAIQAQLEATAVWIYSMDQRLTERLDRVTQTLEAIGHRLEGINKRQSRHLDCSSCSTQRTQGTDKTTLQALDRQHDSINNQTRTINSPYGA